MTCSLPEDKGVKDVDVHTVDKIRKFVVHNDLSGNHSVIVSSLTITVREDDLVEGVDKVVTKECNSECTTI